VRRAPSRLGWPIRIVAGCIALAITLFWFGVQLCGVAENRSELFNDRCGSVFYRQIPLLGFVVLGIGLGVAKALQKRWFAWVGLLLALVPGLLTWELFSV
jgi:hypothetical protein